jgi:hypothetical protein
MVNDIKSLPKKHLHYITAQQSNQYQNFTLNELKILIKRGIRRYIQELEPNYYRSKENELVKFYCVFETTKEFNQNIKNESLGDLPFMGLHFHMFISCPDNYNWISFEKLIFQIFYELTAIKRQPLKLIPSTSKPIKTKKKKEKKQSCISEYGYFKIESLEERFLQYHTKQFNTYPSLEMIFRN